MQGKAHTPRHTPLLSHTLIFSVITSEGGSRDGSHPVQSDNERCPSIESGPQRPQSLGGRYRVTQLRRPAQVVVVDHLSLRIDLAGGRARRDSRIGGCAEAVFDSWRHGARCNGCGCGRGGCTLASGEAVGLAWCAPSCAAPAQEAREMLSLCGCSRTAPCRAMQLYSLFGIKLLVGIGVGSCEGGLLEVLSGAAAPSTLAARIPQRWLCPRSACAVHVCRCT